MAGDLIYHVKKRKKKFIKWLHRGLIQVSGSYDTRFPSTGLFFIFGWTFSFHVYRHQYPHQHHNIPGTVYSDFSEPEWELIWQAATSIQDQLVICIPEHLQQSPRKHRIESCKWGDDSRATKPHCQKDSLTLHGPEKAPPVPLFNYILPNEKQTGSGFTKSY